MLIKIENNKTTYNKSIYLLYMSNTSVIENMIIFELPNDNLNTKLEYEINSYDDYPRFNLGFHHYIHTNKDKLDIITEFEGKKKIYNVMNSFEVNVDDYDKSISNEVEKTIKTKILSKGFYKLWESLMILPLANSKKAMKVAYLSEGPGSFIQCIDAYRKLIAGVKNDTHYAITIIDPKNGQYVPQIDEKLQKNMSNLNVYNTTVKENGDLRTSNACDMFVKKFKIESKVDLVTADGKFKWNNDNTQEQEYVNLLVGQIYTALRCLNKGGNLVLTVYETYTEVSLNLISILSGLFDKLYIHKPLTSRPINSEKFIIGINFKDNASKMINILKDILDQIAGNEKTLYKLKMKTSKLLKTTILKLNNDISNNQLKAINDITTFIDDANFHGDIYIEKNKEQINANSFWLSLFLPNQKDQLKTQSELNKITEELIDRNKSRIEKLVEIIV